MYAVQFLRPRTLTLVRQAMQMTPYSGMPSRKASARVSVHTVAELLLRTISSEDLRFEFY